MLSLEGFVKNITRKRMSKTAASDIHNKNFNNYVTTKVVRRTPR